MKLRGVALAALFSILMGCGVSRPPWIDLPAFEGSTYTISVRTFSDGDYADQPFELRVMSRTISRYGGRMLRAEQCKNVQVFQNNDYVYIFYEDILLTGFTSGFSSGQGGASLPRPVLCDLHVEFCRNTMASIADAGRRLDSVCTYR